MERCANFSKRRCLIAKTRSILGDDSKAFDREAWQAVAEMGWTGAAIPEERDGTPSSNESNHPFWHRPHRQFAW